MDPVITGNIGRPIVRVMIPVFLTLMLVCVFVNLVCFNDPTKCHHGQIQSKMPDGLLTEQPDNDVSKNIEAASIIVSIAIVYIVSVTFILTAVLYFQINSCFYGYSAIALPAFIVITTYICEIIMVALNLAMDYITMAIFVWNFDISTILCFSILDPPELLFECFVIILCSMGALLLTLFLPPLATFSIIPLFCLWDIFAVLAPCGPVKFIAQLLPKMMVYSTSKSTPNEPATPSGKVEMLLGFGDFIIYSLLIGKTNTIGSSAVTIGFVIVTVIFGLITTQVLAVARMQSLPALPISLTLGLLVLAVMNFCAEPMADVLNAMQIHV